MSYPFIVNLTPHSLTIYRNADDDTPIIVPPSGTVAPARLGSGASITTKFLRGDSTWQTIGGGGDMLAANNLSDVQSAATSRTNLGLGALAVLNTVGTAEIDNNAVTLAKLVDATATDKLLGRDTAGTGAVEEIGLSSGLEFTGSGSIRVVLTV